LNFLFYQCNGQIHYFLQVFLLFAVLVCLLEGTAGAARRKVAPSLATFGLGVGKGVGGIVGSSLGLARDLKRRPASG
jgi:hypothetical protein